MSRLSRRRFLVLSSASTAGVACGGSTSPAADTAPDDDGWLPASTAYSAALDDRYVPSAWFPCGVASGDPTPDAVVLWTRVHPDLGEGVTVRVEVATDRAFSDIVFEGQAQASAARDHTVAIDATGLPADTVLYYRFTAAGRVSPPGRTRTTPAPDAPQDRVRIAWFSCQKWSHGFFTGHHDLSWQAADPDTDVHLVLCLGDYVYDKSRNSKPRLNAEGEWTDLLVEARGDEVTENAVTLDEFRERYKHYRSDPFLQAMHANYAFMGVYDNHDGNSPGDDKREGATGAFFEYMPIRVFSDDPERIHRTLRWGTLVEGWLLDQNSFKATGDSLDPAERTLLGAEQRGWLLSGLSGTDAQWKLLGSQKVFSPFRVSEAFDVGLSAWDDADAERQAILDHLADEGIADAVLLSGDAHVFLAAELRTDIDDEAAPFVLTEFSAGLTSSNFDERGLAPSADLWGIFAPSNPHITYAQLDLNGYGIVELTADAAVTTFRQPLSIIEPESETRDLAVVEVQSGSARAVQVAGDPPEEAR